MRLAAWGAYIRAQTGTELARRPESLIEAGEPRNEKTPPERGFSRKRLKGFEPSTFCMASRRSSQLSYSRVAGDSSLAAPSRMRGTTEELLAER